MDRSTTKLAVASSSASRPRCPPCFVYDFGLIETVRKKAVAALAPFFHVEIDMPPPGDPRGRPTCLTPVAPLIQSSGKSIRLLASAVRFIKDGGPPPQ